MKSNRRLALRRETLSELTAGELTLARGGWVPPTLEPGCSVEDIPGHVRDITVRYTLNQRCSWSCP